MDWQERIVVDEAVLTGQFSVISERRIRMRAIPDSHR